MKKLFEKKLQTIGIFTLACVFLLGISGCKKIPIPDGIIKVSNECGVVIDVYLDGVFQFVVEYLETKSLGEIESKDYEIEARRKETGEFVDKQVISVRFNTIFTWHVWSSANLNIMNRYGETLSIFSDDIFTGDLVDQENALLQNFPYGDRKMEAKTSDGTSIAKTTISVLDDDEYEWEIIK